MVLIYLLRILIVVLNCASGCNQADKAMLPFMLAHKTTHRSLMPKPHFTQGPTSQLCRTCTSQ